ncbi:MAG: xanthine dehydrogenase family protein molybdopterin-binding subunit [Myxococcota bacterium]|nr:xanthine dehydrogenase family protein molybdopterin-binding subunit [Myxococcota bacterium]
MAIRPVQVGQRIKRREDPRLIRGLASYTDDLKPHGLLHAAFVRSEHAAGRIVRVNAKRALAREGVVAVYSYDDLRGRVGRAPMMLMPEGMVDVEHPLLADGCVRYVGQPIAVVVARDRYVARDGALDVEVEIEPRPAVADLERALEPDAPRVYEELENNVCLDLPSEAAQDAARVFERADGTVSLRLLNQRVAPVPMEPRAVLAHWDPGPEKLTVWSSTQVPHTLKQKRAMCLELPEIRIRAIAPEVGGGFGCKLPIYPEECVLPWISRELGRPIKWAETRTENLLNTTHGRGHVHEVEAAYQRDGRVLGLRGRILADLGAYASTFGAAIPTFTLLLAPGCYRLEAVALDLVAVYTNTMATDAYRGAGRPEAAYLIERVMDAVARETGIDPVELRRRNFIPSDAFPFETVSGAQYDSADYELALDRAIEAFDYAGARRAQEQARSAGRLIGIGVATFTEICGLGPSTGAAAPARAGTWESGTVRVEPSGNVTVLTGVSPHGQGQETVFAQMVSDAFGVPIEDVNVMHGDTDVVPHGVGTFGSRGIAVGGAALQLALDKVADKARRIAAHLLDTTPERVDFAGGEFRVKDAERALGFREVAEAAHLWSVPVPGEEPGLEAVARFEPEGTTFPFGAHLCQVEVDAETGQISIERYLAVGDSGRVLNPLLADRPRLGGLLQGLGPARCEGVVYDEGGQLVTATLMDYALPKAPMFPRFELHETETPTSLNPLGAKGIGELGTIGATPCLVGAVLDALRPLGVRHLDMPLTPERVWRAIQDAAGGNA